MPSTINAVDGSRRPWHHEPLVWLVIAIPALTVVAGLTTVVTAFRKADVEVSDDVRREGLAIHQDPTRDNAATALGVAATLSLADGHLRVELAPGKAPLPSTLLVVLSHATRAEYDQLVPLTVGADGSFAGTLPALRTGHWYLEITPTDRSWRLTGEFVGSGAQLALSAEAPAGTAGRTL
ncbi:MAG: FixH family protein [Deltaproteobacteria bacterium]